MSKRSYNHTTDNEETLTEAEMKNIIPEFEPEEKKDVSYNAGYIFKESPTWMLKPDDKGGYFKIRYVERIYLKHIKDGWKVE